MSVNMETWNRYPNDEQALRASTYRIMLSIYCFTFCLHLANLISPLMKTSIAEGKHILYVLCYPGRPESESH